MNVDSAIELVNNLVFWPDWKITATDHTTRFEATILVRIDYPAINTNRDKARAGYQERINTYATFPVIVLTCNDHTLYRKIANAILKIYEHEVREGLRVLPSFWAPFHPHRVDGMRRWKKTTKDCDDLVLSDLQFGIG